MGLLEVHASKGCCERCRLCGADGRSNETAATVSSPSQVPPSVLAKRRQVRSTSASDHASLRRQERVDAGVQRVLAAAGDPDAAPAPARPLPGGAALSPPASGGGEGAEGDGGGPCVRSAARALWEAAWRAKAGPGGAPGGGVITVCAAPACFDMRVGERVRRRRAHRREVTAASPPPRPRSAAGAGAGAAAAGAAAAGVAAAASAAAAGAAAAGAAAAGAATMAAAAAAAAAAKPEARERPCGELGAGWFVAERQRGADAAWSPQSYRRPDGATYPTLAEARAAAAAVASAADAAAAAGSLLELLAWLRASAAGGGPPRRAPGNAANAAAALSARRLLRGERAVTRRAAHAQVPLVSP